MKNKCQPAVRQGFTLLETLISVGVIATVATLIAQVFFTTTRANTKTQVLTEVKQNGDFALDVMTRMIRNSISIQSVCDPLGSTLSALDIQNPDGGITEFGFMYDDTNKVSRIASTSASTGDIQYLTNLSVTLGSTPSDSSLQFICSSAPDEADKIQISFQLSQRGTSVSKFETAQTHFQSTVASRN